MGNRKGIIYAAIERLDGLMAINESRRDAKLALREASGEHLWTVSSGKIHSYTTRKVYQQHVLHFINWCRSTYQINRLDRLDERDDELARAYLTWRLQRGCSAYTIQAERAALRMFFGNRDLASAIVLPERKREQITRSRRTTFPTRRSSDNASLPEQKVSEMTEQVAAILKLNVTAALRRIVEEYSTDATLSLLGEADAAREWIRWLKPARPIPIPGLVRRGQKLHLLTRHLQPFCGSGSQQLLT